jgi:hypothetical protein
VPAEEGRTAEYGAAVGVAVVVVDGDVVEDLAVEDEVDATGGVVVAHVDGEVLDASFVGAAGVASGPVVGLGAGAEVDTAVQRGEGRLGIETAYVAVGWKVPFVVEGKGSDVAVAAAADVAVVAAVSVVPEQAASVVVAEAANAAAAVVAVEEPAEGDWTHMEKYTSQEWSEQRQLGDSHEAHLG